MTSSRKKRTRHANINDKGCTSHDGNERAVCLESENVERESFDQEEQAIDEQEIDDTKKGNDSESEESINKREESSEDENEGDNLSDDMNHEEKPKLVKKKALSKKKLTEYNESLLKRGIIYIGRVPPNMQPSKLKHLLGYHGTITRIHLVQEDSSKRKSRVKSGGNRSKRFTEGWIEFEDRKIAKAVAESLNNSPIGGKKGEFFRDDIWNLKFLRHFKWDHLTEKIAYERRMKEQKLRIESMQAKREADSYIEMVEKNKRFKAIGNKRASRGDPVQDSIRREFRQALPVKDVGGESMDQGVLKSVFSAK